MLGPGVALIIDDDSAVRSVARRFLERLGLDVDEADDGEAGLALVRQAPDRYLAALVDLTMPGLDGLEICRALHEIRGDLPVVLMTGYVQRGADPECRDFAAFVQKPFRSEDLRLALERALGRDGAGPAGS